MTAALLFVWMLFIGLIISMVVQGISNWGLRELKKEPSGIHGWTVGVVAILNAVFIFFMVGYAVHKLIVERLLNG